MSSAVALQLVSRTDILKGMVVQSMIAVTTPPSIASAKIWTSGKNPDGPAPKGETKGTKKDYNYLQCLSGCLANCQKPAIGKAEKERSTCLNECRDECCSTYEQCTYTIAGT